MTTMAEAEASSGRRYALMSVREVAGEMYGQWSHRQRLWAAMVAEAVLFGVLEDLEHLCEQGTAREVGEEAGRRLLAVRRG